MSINVEDLEDKAHSSERRDEVASLRESQLPYKFKEQE